MKELFEHTLKVVELVIFFEFNQSLLLQKKRLVSKILLMIG